MRYSKEELEKQKQERLGETRRNKDSLGGYKMKIIEYNGRDDIIVEFQDEYKAKIHTCYNNFLKGGIKNPYNKSVCNIGYLGEGKYNHKDYPKMYNHWIHMIRRCYNPYALNRNPTYIDCFICESWHCFQNFGEWYERKYYECNNEEMHLDKDILIKGNKIYSPNTCIFVPKRINALFTKRQNDRGDCPIGVRWHKRDKKFDVSCNDANCNQQYLGRFDNEIDAFICYKNYKEKVIKQVADEYKELIPKELYEAVYKYEVEIND